MPAGHENQAPTALSSRFDSPQQQAYLSLWRTYDRLRRLEDEFFEQYDLTAQQYNLLRLLQAQHPKQVGPATLGERLISRAPDVTRMLDKLESRGLIRRTRTASDRRAILVGLTDAGRRLLEDIAEPLRACHDRQLGHLTLEELETLIALLHRARWPHEADGSPWKSF
jgi:DNA-binding MarR family transcriptional regulator